MKRRLIAVALVAAALTAGVVGLSPAPANAAQWADLVGNFAGDDREEIFFYSAGSAPDAMGSLAYDEGTGEPFWSFVDHTVNGTYDPIVGNFDGDAFDEILWYARGAAQDYIWNFTSMSTYTTRPYTVNGTYTPVAGDFTGDGTDDIVWYAPGTGQDFIWDYVADGTYTSAPFTISGRYTPVAGSFGTNATDDILWYAPGTGRDFLWDFNPGGTTYASRPFTINGTFRPVVHDMWNDGWGGEDIFWYAPGTAPDYQWDFVDGTYGSWDDPVNGSYPSVVAGDFFADLHDDFAFFGTENTHVWDHYPTEEGLFRAMWTWDGSSAAATSAETSGGDVEGVSPTRGPVVEIGR